MARNGFEALIDLDGGTRLSDGQIDGRDTHYSRLRLWIDRNHNGSSDPHELMGLAEAGVTAIRTTYRESPRTDRNGNSYKYLGEALVRRNGRDVQRKVFDVILKIAP